MAPRRTNPRDGGSAGEAGLHRYSRHLLLPEVGLEGQRKLLAGKVLIVGAGGLGAPISLYLAAAGVGRIGLVDFDRVDVTNLQRQVIYSTSDVGRSKARSAQRRLHALNPEIDVRVHEERLDRSNARQVLKPYDVIVDGSDNFATRYLVNDACVLLGKPDVYGSVFRFEGQATVFDGRIGPCYRCLFPEPPPPGSVPSCAEGGVLGVVPGMVGLIQATETIKLLLGVGDPLVGRLLLVDLLSMQTRELSLKKSPECPICSAHPTQTGLVDYPAMCGDAPGSPAPAGVALVTAGELDGELAGTAPPFVIDVRTRGEWALGHLAPAVHIPLSDLGSRMGEIPTDRPVVAYCQSGRRSAAAVQLLSTHGWPTARSLAGGIEAWEARTPSKARARKPRRSRL